MKVAVIGAGLAGLCAAKHSVSNGFEVTVFEKANTIGGTWVYSENIETDEFGSDVHSSMYKSLRTNFPKEVMGFPDFEFTGPLNSYVSAGEVLEFLKKYAAKFEVEKNIKFCREVIRVQPTKGYPTKWEILVRNLLNNSAEINTFDAIICCNGHYNCPRIPTYPGQSMFKGRLMHSHRFRTADEFNGETLLIIGCGDSALDIAYLTSKVSKKTTISYRNTTTAIPNEIHSKPDVCRFTEDGVVFIDGSYEQFDVIIFCTGYLYSFPFLTVDCGITVEDNHIEPLFKHCININHPTMCFIGMPYLVHPTHISHLQVQLFLKYLSGTNILPTRDEMLKVTNDEMEGRKAKGFVKKQAHMMGMELLGEYYNDLSMLSGEPVVRPVLLEIYREHSKNMQTNYLKFRDVNFEIIDDEHFEAI